MGYKITSKDIERAQKRQEAKGPKRPSKCLFVLQIIITIVAAFLAIASFFEETMVMWLQILVALDMLVMALNNHFSYKRKYFTALYVLVALFIGYLVVSRLIWG